MFFTFRRLAVASLCIVIATSTARAQSTVEWSAARYLPPDVSIVLNAQDIGSRWAEIEKSNVFQNIIAIPQVRELLAEKPGRDLRNGLRFVESMFGRPIVDLIQDFSQNGATLAWKSEREIALLFRPTSDSFDKLKQTLKEFAQAAALSNQQKSNNQLFSATYRGIEAFGFDTARIGFCNGWVVACSTSEFGKAVLDRVLGDKMPSLADEDWFQTARDLAQSLEQGSTPALIALANCETLRAGGKLKIERGKDAGQEVLIGGILDALSATPVAVATVELNDKGARAMAAIPRPKNVDDRFEYFFGTGRLQAAPAPIDLPNRILSARWHRDIGLFWKMAPQIISDENALAGIAKAESDISTLLGGMVTVSDVFQYLGPDVEFVALQPIADAENSPSLKFPAFGISGTLRESAKAQPALRLAFQQVVSFANLNASAGMYPPLEVVTEKEAGKTLISGSYFAMEQSAMANQPGADMYKNFSPTLGFFEDQFVLASHRDLAEQVLNAPRPKLTDSGSAPFVDNTVIEVWPAELAKVGSLNREPLISQRMLTTGQARPEAAADIDAFITLLQQFATAKIRLKAANEALVVELETQFAKPTPANNSR